MKKNVRLSFIALVMIIAVSGCQTQTERTHYGEWLGGSPEEIITEIENQFAGFSQTMWEMSYRHNELYWAGSDGNWEYADYQLEHMLEALEQGFVRRPEREASSAQFVNQAAPAILQTIISGDQQVFMEQFALLTSSCNTCHAMEEMPFIAVNIPEIRNSAVKF